MDINNKIRTIVKNTYFSFYRFGPGGISRCLRLGDQFISPIEFEALAGKKSKAWKVNIRLVKNKKPLRFLFENEVLKRCHKRCECSNCDIGRKFPTNFELLIDTIYRKKTELCPVKVEPLTPEKTEESLPEQKRSDEKSSESKTENEEPSPMRLKRLKGGDTEDSVTCHSPVFKANAVIDEFCTSVESSPKDKENTEDPEVKAIVQVPETAIPKRIVVDKNARALTPRSPTRVVVSPSPILSPTPLSNGIAEFALNKELPPLLIQLPEIVDEMAPTLKTNPEQEAKPSKTKRSLTPNQKGKKQQQDIRAFFSPPGKDSDDIEIIVPAEKPVPEVDLTVSPEKTPRAQIRSPERVTRQTTGEMQTKNSSNKKGKTLRSPVEISIRKETLVRHTRGTRLPDRTEIVKQKHALSRHNSMSSESGDTETHRRVRSKTQSPGRGNVIRNH